MGNDDKLRGFRPMRLSARINCHASMVMHELHSLVVHFRRLEYVHIDHYLLSGYHTFEERKKENKKTDKKATNKRKRRTTDEAKPINQLA